MRNPARALALVPVIVALLASAAQPAAAATQQYPDLRTLPPRDLELDRADITADGSGNFHNVLRFSNTVWNVGRGKLVMRGRINSATKDGTSYQRIYDDAGGFTDVPVGRFYWHAEHSHYHYDNWGRYQLFTKAEYDAWVANGRPATLPSGVEVGTKTTSCVMDEEFIKGIVNTPYPAVFPSSGCMPDANNDLWEGISPGWGDTYDYWRYEQWIDLGANGTLSDGQYVLRSVTDDKNQIHESADKADTSRENQVDNEGVTLFSVAGGKLVDTNPPTGSVTINDVDSQTRSTGVTVKVLGRDDLVGPNDSPGVDTVQLSNDGVNWKSYTYTGAGSHAQSIAWNLADPATGGNANGGTKTVYAKFRDRSGKWSQNETDTIELSVPDVSSKYAQAVVADNPVSYWRLGETGGTQAVDDRGANSGVFTGGPALGQPGLVAGDTNKAAALDGTNDHVRVAASSSLNFTNRFAVEAWIKPTAVPAAGSWASVVTKPEAYSIQFNGPRLEFTVMQNGTRQRVQAAAGAVVAGQTYHVVGTFDGTTQRIYLNGVEVANRALAGSASTSSAALFLGSWDGTQEFFRGTLDDVAVYGSALSATRVKEHFAAAGGTTTPPPPVTVAAPSGTTASPASPYAADVRWTDNASNEGNYVIERSTDAAFTAPRVITLPANTTSYSDSGLDPATAYWYRVRATAGTASSAWSNTATTTTPQAPAANSYSQVVLGDGPSSYWRLSETSGTVASDQKTANPGAYVNSPMLGQPSLLTSDTQNRALGLDGTGDRMRVPAAASLNLTSAVTLEAVIKPTSIPQFGFASVLTKAEAYSLQFNSGRMEFTIMQNGTRRRLQAPSGAVVAGQRYHVVGTFDGVTQRLYLNGVQVGSQALSGTASIYGSDLYVGSWSGSDEYFNGVVDEAAVYARTLSATQVKTHWDSAVAAPATGTAASTSTTSPAPTAAMLSSASAEPTESPTSERAATTAAPAPAPEPAARVASAPAPVAGTPTGPAAAKPRTKPAKKKSKPKRCNKRALRAGGNKAAAARRTCRARR